VVSRGTDVNKHTCLSQVDRHVGEALEAMKELEKHIGQKKENKAKVLCISPIQHMCIKALLP